MNSILMTFGHLSWQKGSVAQVLSFIQEVRKISSSVRFVLLSQYTDLDQDLAANYDIETVGYPHVSGTTPSRQNLKWLLRVILLVIWSLVRKVGISASILVRNPVARAFFDADLIADLSGDSYRDRPGGFSPAHNILILAAILLKKPVVLVSQSIGPFRWYGKSITPVILNRCRLIYVREKETVSLLDRIGIDKNLIALAPDIAFKLPLPEKEHLQALRRSVGIFRKNFGPPKIGISMSCLMEELPVKGANYMAEMVTLCMHVRSKYGAEIVLVPHVINKPELGTDDVKTCENLLYDLDDPVWVTVVKGDYSPIELKGIISGCDIFVAARMHAGIAALSSGVPAVFLSWSHKYRGLMQEIGLEHYVWELSSESNRDLPTLIDELWENRIELRHILNRYNIRTGEPIEDVLRKMLAITKTHAWKSSRFADTGIISINSKS